MPRHARTLTAALLFLAGVALVAAVAAEPPPSATGANVDESRVARTYYVDAAAADAADDDKHGTQEFPFSTVSHACQVALRDKESNVGAKIVVAAGIYREAISIGPPGEPGNADTDAPLIIEADERDQTIIDCADSAGWEATSWQTESGTLTHRWPFQREHVAAALGRSSRNTPSTPGVYTHSDLVFLNGTALRQVDGASALAPGTFCVSTSGDRRARGAAAGGIVRVRAPEDADAAVFQVGSRGSGLVITALRNVVVRGLLFQHAANPGGSHLSGAPATGLALIGCSNVLVEDVLSQWNDGSGLLIEGSPEAPWSSGVTLRRVRLIHNGGSGLIVAGLKNLLVEDSETSFNNFRGEWAGWIDPGVSSDVSGSFSGWAVNPDGPAGTRARSLHGSTWRRHRAVGNTCRGMWWTGDCTDLTIEDCVVRENVFSGLLIQNCPGPTVVRGCMMVGNHSIPGAHEDAAYPAAVSIDASPDVTLENNVIAGNRVPQLGLWDIAERSDGTNFETRAKETLRSERHAYRHNVFWGANPDQVMCDLPVTDRTGKGDFAFYYGTLDSDENCFWNTSSSDVFCTYDRTNYHRPGLALAGWRTFLLAHSNAGGGAGRKPEAGSLWEDPLFVEPAEGDFRLQTQSSLTDWGLPADEGTVAQ